MYLTHLSLTNFRSFARLDMEVPRHNLLLVGDNAQGKTSLLEAVYFFATFTSLQAAHDRQLINFLETDETLKVARLVADIVSSARQNRLEVRLILDTNLNETSRFRKEILVDGVKRTIQEALGLFNAVIFLPQMTRILEGGPEERRKYLNLALSQVHSGYARALSDYAHLLTRRNALLKLLGERGGDQKQLDYWDELLAQRGAFLMKARMGTVLELERLAAAFHDRLTGGEEILRIQYKPSFQPEQIKNGQFPLVPALLAKDHYSLDEIQQAFILQLKSRRSEEISRGVTLSGPHRDDLRFISNQIDLSSYGSRGQIRTTLLALKLAEVHWMHERTNEWPVLLLDETLAELDPQRRTELMDVLQESEQSILTTTDLSQFTPEFIQDGTIWQVRAGSVLPADQLI